MDKVTARVDKRSQQAADLAWWRSRPVAERLAAVEVLRQQFDAAHPEPERGPHAEPGLQRICRIVARARR
jgi:hypothetical protein